MKALLLLLFFPLACVGQHRPVIYPKQARTGLIAYTQAVPAPEARQDILYRRALRLLDAQGYVVKASNAATGRISAYYGQEMKPLAGQIPSCSISYTLTLRCREGEYRYEFVKFTYTYTTDEYSSGKMIAVHFVPAESLLPTPRAGIKMAPYAAAFKRQFDQLIPARISALRDGMRQR
jgi:hypothetical protein